MKRRLGKVLGLSAFGVGLLVAAWGQAAAPTTEPAKLPEGVRKAMACAPPGAWGVVHFDIAAMRPALLKILSTNQELADELRFDPKAAAALFAKTEAADVFLCSPPGSGRPLLVLRGKAALKDVLALPKGGPLKATSIGNGRYDLGSGRNPPRLIVGAEAKDVAKGLLIVGRSKIVTDEVVAKLGEKPDPELRQVLAKVKPDAAIWVAVNVEKLGEGGAPKHVIGGIDAAGKAASGFSMVFAEDKHADEALRELRRPQMREILRGTAVTKLAGARLTLSLPKGPQVLDTVAASVVAYGQAVKRNASATQVRNICTIARMHERRRGGPAPSLLVLIQGRLPARFLISPVSGRKLKTDKEGNPIGPFDYIYVAVSTQGDGGLPRARRVLAYERPENYNNKGTVVGYADGHSEWVTIEKFKEDLKATQEWLAKQGK